MHAVVRGHLKCPSNPFSIAKEFLRDPNFIINQKILFKIVILSFFILLCNNIV